MLNKLPRSLFILKLANRNIQTINGEDGEYTLWQILVKRGQNPGDLDIQSMETVTESYGRYQGDQFQMLFQCTEQSNVRVSL